MSDSKQDFHNLLQDNFLLLVNGDTLDSQDTSQEAGNLEGEDNNILLEEDQDHHSTLTPSSQDILSTSALVDNMNHPDSQPPMIGPLNSS